MTGTIMVTLIKAANLVPHILTNETEEKQYSPHTLLLHVFLYICEIYTNKKLFHTIVFLNCLLGTFLLFGSKQGLTFGALATFNYKTPVSVLRINFIRLEDYI